MLIADLLVLCFISIIIEFKFLKGKSMIFSPFTNFNVSFALVYILPIILYRISPNTSLIQMLSQEELMSSYLYIRIFYYSWFLLSVVYFISTRRYSINVVKGVIKPSKEYLLFLWFILLLLYFVGLAAPLGFDPVLTLARLINPRAFTYIRAGYGPFNHVQNAVKLIMIVIATYMFSEKKSLGRLFLMVLSLLMNILGGSKASFVNFLLAMLLIWHKMDYKFKRVKIGKLLRYGLVGMVLVIFAFMAFYKPGEVITFQEAIYALRDYQKEAYYTTRVINDYDWDIIYTVEGITDTITPFVPRAIWPDKPFSGFYHRYWRMRYEPGTVVYHTSTFGVLAESYMMFGYLGCIIYAYLFYVLCKRTFIYGQKTNTLFGLFVVSYIQVGMYFLVRFGLFSSRVVAFVYQTVVAYVLLVILRKLFGISLHSRRLFVYRKL